jgi:hypothetical protein
LLGESDPGLVWRSKVLGSFRTFPLGSSAWGAESWWLVFLSSAETAKRHGWSRKLLCPAFHTARRRWSNWVLGLRMGSSEKPIRLSLVLFFYSISRTAAQLLKKERWHQTYDCWFGKIIPRRTRSATLGVFLTFSYIFMQMYFSNPEKCIFYGSIC